MEDNEQYTAIVKPKTDCTGSRKTREYIKINRCGHMWDVGEEKQIQNDGRATSLHTVKYKTRKIGTSEAVTSFFSLFLPFGQTSAA